MKTKTKQPMNPMSWMTRTLALGLLAAAGWLAVSGCVYDVPITAKPTRPIDARLLGNWTSTDGKARLKVVKFDNDNYIVSKVEDKGEDLYRVWHSDVAKTPLVTVQILEEPKTQYAYWVWNLSEDGRLHLRMVNDKIIPDDVKRSSSVQAVEKESPKPGLVWRGKSIHERQVTSHCTFTFAAQRSRPTPSPMN